MTIELPISTAVVPAQNNRIEPHSAERGLESFPAELITKIFSHLSPKDLFRCSRINKQWRAIASRFLGLLEDPRGSQLPIYTRAELLEKVRMCVARLLPNQEFRLNAELFRAVGAAHSTIKKSSSVKTPLALFTTHPPITLEAMIDEVSSPLHRLIESRQFGEPDYVAENGEAYYIGRSSNITSIQLDGNLPFVTNAQSSSEVNKAPVDLSVKIDTMIHGTERRILESLQPQSALTPTRVTAAVILFAVAAFHFLMNISQRIPDPSQNV